MKNWFKKSQQQLNNYLNPNPSSIKIIGSGVGYSFTIPGLGRSLNSGTLLREILPKIQRTLTQNGVHTIDTSPVSKSNAIGLAVSHEPGIIHVDVKKIVDNIKNHAMPLNVQTDGGRIDKDQTDYLIKTLTTMIESELVNTSAHESKHMNDYRELYKQNKPFSGASEQSAVNFGNTIQKQVFK